MFRADTVLAKHDENYMPKDVADALKKQGLWKEEYGAASKGGINSTHLSSRGTSVAAACSDIDAVSAMPA